MVRPKLFLDDERFPPDDGAEWMVIRTVADAIDFMINECPAFISFDHDLGENQPTGYDLVNWMIERDLDEGCNFIPTDFEFYVHSQNPVGAENIRSKLTSYLVQRFS